jgi:hypothetical protein
MFIEIYRKMKWEAMEGDFDEKLLEALKIAEEIGAGKESRSEVEAISADKGSEKEAIHADKEIGAEEIGVVKESDEPKPDRNVNNSKRAEAAAKKAAKQIEKQKRPKKLRDPWSLKKKLVVIFMILIVLFVAVPVCIAGVLLKKGREQLQEQAAFSAISFHEDGSPSEAVRYNGKNYDYDDDVISILVFGVDNSTYEKKEAESETPDMYGIDASDLEGTETTEAEDTRNRDDEITYSDANESEYVRYGGRIDMCFLLVFHLSEKRIDVININRDSVTSVNICTTEGEIALTDYMQLTLAYGYADGAKISCENFTDAVSKMMYHLPIQAYVAIDMEGIADINDAVKGVTLLAKETVSENVFEKDSVTLEGEDAYRYLEQMDTVTDAVGEHAKRMDRQSQYFAAWIERFLQCFADDKGIVKTLYNTAKPYIQTNLNWYEVLYLMYQMKDMNLEITEDQILELPGEYVRNRHFDEYRLDNEKLVELLLQVFYKESAM